MKDELDAIAERFDLDPDSTIDVNSQTFVRGREFLKEISALMDRFGSIQKNESSIEYFRTLVGADLTVINPTRVSIAAPDHWGDETRVEARFEEERWRIHVEGYEAIAMIDTESPQAPFVETPEMFEGIGETVESTAPGVMKTTPGSRRQSATAVTASPSPLPEPGRARLPLVLRGHTGWVGCVVFSGDGAWIASGSADKTVRLWDTFSGRQMAVFRGHEDRVEGLVSLSGELIASAGADQTVRVWDRRTGRQLSIIRVNGPLHCLAASPDGLYIATGQNDGVHIYGVNDGHEVISFPTQGRRVQHLAYGPELTSSRQLLGAAVDDSIVIWNTVSGKRLQRIVNVGGKVFSLAFSPEGLSIAAGSRDRSVNVWEIASGKVERTFRNEEAIPSRVAFSPDGRIIAVAGSDGRVLVRNVRTGKTTQALRGMDNAIWGLAFGPEGKRIAVCGRENELHVISAMGEPSNIDPDSDEFEPWKPLPSKKPPRARPNRRRFTR
jgi:WD40 repeat protein